MTTSKEPARVRAGPSLANFAFLGRYDDLLVRIAAVAERPRTRSRCSAGCGGTVDMTDV
jgi:hypothetical protein